MTPISGKTVLVTGAARRIGRALALRLAREGARVAIHYSTSQAEAEATAGECGGAPLFRADLERVGEIQRLYAEVAAHFGRLDAVVNNAARFTKIDPLEVSEADWDFIHSVNLKSVFFSCQAAARLMLAQPDGGRIVNISSCGGLRPWPHHAHYCASKAGVIHLTRALAVAWAPKVSVNTVAPGVIPFGEETVPGVAALISKTPAGRAGTGDEIADAVLYYLQASTFTTGQTFAVDGGLSLI
jgi:NAD(P)-dependent dehydrogenase (short-subunit alcohol dehydrogenase family)